MNQRAIGAAAVLDAQGRVLAVVGSCLATDPQWDTAPRTPLPGGGFLASLPAEPLGGEGDWPRFARAYVHEARSPLNALGIYLELLGTKPAPNAVRPGFSLEKILTKAQEQVKRVDDLLRNFSSLWAPRGDVADLASMARAAARFADHEANRVGLRFHKEIADNATVELPPLSVASAVITLLAGLLGAEAESDVTFQVQRTGDRVCVRAEVQPSGQIAALSPGIQAFRELGADVTCTEGSLSASLPLCSHSGADERATNGIQP
jgi:hypothetical protein